MGGKQWYADPNNADTNNDGLADAQECWSSYTPGDNSLPCDKDTDGDKVPDLFDTDNDADGVPDKIDLSPSSKMGSEDVPFSRESPFELAVSGLHPNYPVFVDFQLRPKNPAHLTYALNMLDWPSGDQEGQIQRHVGNNSTFQSAAQVAGQGSTPQDANGDVRLVPMLEISIPYDGGYGNLPTTLDVLGTRAPTDPVDDWLDKSKLEPYGVSVRLRDETGDLLVYVPLNVVTDDTGGGRAAFSARMPYLPRAATWGQLHQVRVVWMVVMLIDSCKPVPPGTPEIQAAVWCYDVGHWVLDRQQPVHTYAEDWYLTGLEVREDHGLDVAIAWEDPTTDADVAAGGRHGHIRAGGLGQRQHSLRRSVGESRDSRGIV
jgi:hypothetical protein